MKRIEDLIHYLKAKKPKDKKQRIIQCIVGLSLGLPIAFMINKSGFESTCKKHIAIIQDKLDREASGRASLECGTGALISSSWVCVSPKEEIKQEMEKNRIVGLEERLCSYLIGK